MTSYLKVLSLDTVDSSACVAFVSDNCKLLFNVGEGVQRLCVEHRFRLSKLTGVFLTEFSPSTVGGFPGLLLTSADAGLSSLKLTGPEGCFEFWKSTRFFMMRSDFSLKIEIPEKQRSTTACGDVSVTTIPVTDHTGKLTKLCYLCETPTLPGKFILSKAVALGVPKGPAYSQLKNGSDVVLSDGTVITPSQVLEEPEVGRKFAIICRFSSPESFELNQVFGCGIWNSATLDVMVHLSCSEVVSSDMYQQWLATLPRTIVHIGVGFQVAKSQTSFFAASHYSNKLHAICPELFSRLELTTPLLDKPLMGNPSKSTAASGNTVNQGQLVVQSTSLSNNAARGVINNTPLISGCALQQFNILPARVRGLLEPQLMTPAESPSIPAPSSSVSSAALFTLGGIDVLIQQQAVEIEALRCVVIEGAKESNSSNMLQSSNEAAVVSPELTSSLLRLREEQTKIRNLGPISLSSIEENDLLRDANLYCGECSESKSDPIEGASDELNYYRNYNSRPARQLRCNRESQLIFLGTGCATPSKYRNVSGILLQLHPTDVPKTDTNGTRFSAKSMLLDAGEGTWQQLVRMAYNSPQSLFGINCDEYLATHSLEYLLAQMLSVVFVSHPHADHHLGLPHIISERTRILTDPSNGVSTLGEISFSPLLVIAPPTVLCFLEEYSELEGSWKSGYCPLSTRQLDPFDDCSEGDVYWRSVALGVIPGVLKQGSYLREEDDGGFVSGDVKNQQNDQQSGINVDIGEGGKIDSDSATTAWKTKASTDLQTGLNLLAQLGVCSIATTMVVHCKQSYGIAVDFDTKEMSKLSTCRQFSVNDVNFHQWRSDLQRDDVIVSSCGNMSSSPSFFKMVYSGDTRPSNNLVNIGYNANILIHEATFDDSQELDAVTKRHSTVGEALEVAKNMGAFRTILTHFSQRYPHVPLLPPQFPASQSAVMAFDCMHINFSDLLWAPAITTPLALLLPNNDEEEREDEAAATATASANAQTTSNQDVAVGKNSKGGGSKQSKVDQRAAGEETKKQGPQKRKLA